MHTLHSSSGRGGGRGVTAQPPPPPTTPFPSFLARQCILIVAGWAFGFVLPLQEPRCHAPLYLAACRVLTQEMEDTRNATLKYL